MHRTRSQGDETPTVGVSIRLLGGFDVTIDDERPSGRPWRLRKGRDLVKLLALAPAHRLHREQLMEALWPDRDPAVAANNLNQVVHAARRVLGSDAIELDDGLLTLHAVVDVDEFERAAEHARRSGSAGAIGGALALYAGELLPEDRYEDWAIARREQLEELRAGLESESLERASEEHVYKLPEQASSFVGREHELDELAALLRGTRLLTLAGVGGCGKTRLALELARRSERLHANGLALVELANVHDERNVPTATAAALDLAAMPGRSALDAVVDYLAPRTVLLVLDNCEHVLPASASLCDALLRAAPRLRILTTTREPLRVPGEVVFRVPSLGIPDPARVVEPAGLVRYEAVALLAERGAAAVPGFRVDDENAADVARICFRLDGLPLAIELAAARLGALGTRTLADRLDDRFRLLRGGTRVAPSRQQTLSATLQWSHDLLADDERVLLRRLAVFAGGFQLEAAEAVCADDELPEVAVADVLARLVEKSLVATSAGGPELRYRLLETVRLYARERLDEAAETNAIARRQARWALARARQEGDSPQLDADAANLRIAHRSLAARDRLSYCVALLPFWMRRIDLDEAHRRLAAALDAAPERTELRADALMAESAIDFRAGTLRCGEDHAHESYEIARELGAAAVQRRALQRLGEFAVARDDAERAAAFFEQARSLARREGLSSGEALSIYSLGVVDWLVGDVDGAEGLIADSLTALGSAGDDELVSSPLNMAELRPAHKVAPLRLRIVFEETLHPFLEISCQAAIGYVLANQATIARLRGEPDRAALLLDDASRRFAGMGDLRGEAAVLIRRGHLELAVGALDAARQCFERSLELRRAMADRRGVGMALSGLGLTGILSGSYDLAARQLEEALELFRRAGDRWGIVSVLWRTADLAMACGDPEGARRALEDARAVVGETERQNWIDVTIAMQAEVARLRGPGERTGPRLARAAAESARPVQSGAAAMQTRRKSSSRTTGSSTTPKRRRT